MKTLINHYYQTEPIVDDMTEAKPSYVGMAIALGLVADPDYRYELQGFSAEEIRQIKANVAMKMKEVEKTKANFECESVHFLGDREDEIAA